MSLGEVREVSEDIYAYLQPDGRLVPQQHRLPGPHRGDAGVISVDAARLSSGRAAELRKPSTGEKRRPIRSI